MTGRIYGNLVSISYRLILAGTLIVCGCSSTKHYKQQADKEAYQIIEEKWDESFGKKANYRISDVEPSPNDIIFDINNLPSGIVTLPRAVAIATANNRDYQSRKEDLYLTAMDLTLVRHDFAKKWFGTIDGTYLKQGETDLFGSEERYGFSQLLADGAQISTSIAIDWTRFFIGDPSRSLQSVLVATVTQPLLRGAGRKVVQEQLTQSERNVLYEIRQFSRFRKSFVVSIVNEYLRVLQRRDEVKNAQANFERRAESKKRLEMEENAGRRNRVEVDQAVQDWLRARDSLVRTKQRYQQSLDEFKLTLALPMDVNILLDPNALNYLEKMGVTEIKYTLTQAIDTALTHRLDLMNSLDRIDDATRKAMVAEDNLGAELNLIGSASVPTDDTTAHNSLRLVDGRYSIGIEADLPFDRKRERNAYRESLIALTRQQRNYTLDYDNVILDVRQAYRELDEAAERYKIQENSLKLAKKRVHSTSMLLNEGRVTTRDLLESQDALLEAQNSLTAALIDHTIAKLNFFKDIGVLQVKPDGMWQVE